MTDPLSRAAGAPIAIQKARDLFFLGKLDEAEVVCQKAQRVASESKYADFLLGCIRYKENKLIQAEGLFREAAAGFPNNADVLNMLGLTLLESNREEEAIELFYDALDKNPDHSDALLNIGNSFLARNEASAAVAWFRQAQARNPNQPVLSRSLADAYFSQKRFEACVEVLRQALKNWPDDFYAANLLAVALFRLNRVEDAFTQERLAIRLFPLDRLPDSDPPDQWDTQLAAAGLKLIKSCLDSAGIQFFLIAGTLLGCMRDGALIPWDDDVDIGVFEEVPIERILEAMELSPDLALQSRPDPDAIHFCIIFRDLIAIDIFRYFRDGNRMWCGLYQHQRQIRWSCQAFTLRECTFLGTTFQVPADTERFLTESYGDWRVPDPHHDAIGASDNATSLDPVFCLYISCNQLFKALDQGYPEKANSLCQQILKIDPHISEVITVRDGLLDRNPGHASSS